MKSFSGANKSHRKITEVATAIRRRDSHGYDIQTIRSKAFMSRWDGSVNNVKLCWVSGYNNVKGKSTRRLIGKACN